MHDTRRRFWIDPFQTKLFYRVALYWIIYTITLFNFLFAWRLLRDGSENLGQVFVATVYDNIPLLVSALFVTPWLALDAVRFANRLVGPLYRFRMTMRSVAANEPVRPIRLRQDDFLIDMQDEFNAMLDALAERGGVRTVEPAEATAKVGG